MIESFLHIISGLAHSPIESTLEDHHTMQMVIVGMASEHLPCPQGHLGRLPLVNCRHQCACAIRNCALPLTLECRAVDPPATVKDLLMHHLTCNWMFLKRSLIIHWKSIQTCWLHTRCYLVLWALEDLVSVRDTKVQGNVGKAVPRAFKHCRNGSMHPNKAMMME